MFLDCDCYHSSSSAVGSDRSRKPAKCVRNGTNLYYKFIWLVLFISCFYFRRILSLLIFSPIGKIKLGKQDEKPEFNLLSWFAMLFSAGMGIGLVFTVQLNRSAILQSALHQVKQEPLKLSGIHSDIHFSTGGCTHGPSTRL